MDPKWTLEICATGFFFLAGWSLILHTKMSQVWDVKTKVDEIHKALMGDLKEEGLISRQRRMEKECSIRHPGAVICMVIGTILLISSLAMAYSPVYGITNRIDISDRHDGK